MSFNESRKNADAAVSEAVNRANEVEPAGTKEKSKPTGLDFMVRKRDTEV